MARQQTVGFLALAGLAGSIVATAPLAGQFKSSAPAAPQAAPSTTVQGDQRILHALDRFTFGPRLGDVASVKAIGLNRWFDQQLNPESIDDSFLLSRLADYPAMNLSVAALSARYPGPQAIKQMLAGKVALPTDPAERVMVEDQIALYKIQQAKQAEKKAGTDPAPPQPMAHDDVVKIISLPPADRVRAVINLPPEDLPRFRQGLKGSDAATLRAGLTPAQKETLEALNGSVRMVSAEAMESRLLRDLYSERQLEAVMTDFWLNHFNVYSGKSQSEPYLIPTYEREAIRAHALGNFEDLLVATAESPAMLEYLDNSRSIGPNSFAAQHQKKQAGLNENYGRELMELHTLGVNGAGYTQADVTQVAKVFTGWTVERPDQEDGGTFTFNDRRHEPGSKIVLGHRIPESGVREGLTVLHMLATNPATAHFICTQLAVRFVSDTPPPALVDRMSASFLQSHGDIKTVLRTLWQSPEFWSADVYRAKVKTPEEFVLSAARASGADVREPAALVQSINKLGMPLYGMQTPQGYSWKQDDWVSTGALVSRMNFALVFSNNRLGGTQVNLNNLLNEKQATMVATEYSAHDAADTKEFRLESGLMGQPVSAKTRSAVLSQALDTSVTEQAATQFDLTGSGKGQIYRPRQFGKPGAPPDDPQAAVMAGLLLGSPEFQRR